MIKTKLNDKFLFEQHDKETLLLRDKATQVRFRSNWETVFELQGRQTLFKLIPVDVKLHRTVYPQIFYYKNTERSRNNLSFSSLQ